MGLVTAAQFIRAGTYKNIVVVGADALSRYIDWRDRGEGCTDGGHSREPSSRLGYIVVAGPGSSGLPLSFGGC